MVVPIPGLNRAVVQAINVAPLDQRRHPGRLHLRRPGRRRRSSARRLRAADARASRSSSSSRRTGRWPARCSPTSTSSTRPGRRTSPSRSRSSSSPSTSPAAGGSGSSTTRPSKRLRTVLLGRPHTVVVERARTGARTRTLFEAAPSAERGATDREAPERRRHPADGSVAPSDRATTRRRWYRDRRPCQMTHHTRLPAGGPRPQRRPERRPDRPPRRRTGRASPRPSSSPSMSSRSTGRCRSTPTSPAAPRRSSACSTSPRRSPRSPSSASSRSCSRRATSGRPSSTRRPSAAPTCSSLGVPVPHPVRRRVRHRPDHPLRPAERAVRRLGRARADDRGAVVKIVIVGCGRVGASIAEACDRAGHEVIVIDIADRRLRPPAVDASAGAPSAATAPTRTSCAGPAPRARTSSSP